MFVCLFLCFFFYIQQAVPLYATKIVQVRKRSICFHQINSISTFKTRKISFFPTSAKWVLKLYGIVIMELSLWSIHVGQPRNCSPMGIENSEVQTGGSESHPKIISDKTNLTAFQVSTNTSDCTAKSSYSSALNIFQNVC